MIESDKPTLHELQKWMRWVITDPRGVKGALTAPCDSNLGVRFQAPNVNAYSAILDLPPVSVEARLNIYAEGYFARIAESMAQDFPTVLKIIGKDLFLKLLADYLKEHPSREFSLGEIGKSLSGFSRTHFLVKDFPLLPDLAHLEWLMILSFYAKDLPPFDVSGLASMNEEDWVQAKVTLDPSLFVFRSHWPVDKLWLERANDEATTQCQRSKDELQFQLYRHDGLVEITRVSFDQAACLEALQKGLPFLEAVEKLKNPTQAQAWFAELMGKGVIRKLAIPSKGS